MSTTIVVYCYKCDYFLKTAIQGAIGTHGCITCGTAMEVYVPQELAAPDWHHHEPKQQRGDTA